MEQQQLDSINLQGVATQLVKFRSGCVLDAQRRYRQSMMTFVLRRKCVLFFVCPFRKLMYYVSPLPGVLYFIQTGVLLWHLFPVSVPCVCLLDVGMYTYFNQNNA